MDVGSNITLLSTPTLESIEEFKIITNGYMAEHPRSGGGMVNVVTKSGTQEFSGSAYEFFRDSAFDENTYFAVRMLLKVGGGDPTHGPLGGIHWHMNRANKIEYIATDEARQTIPWVRLTDPAGNVTEFRTPEFADEPAARVLAASAVAGTIASSCVALLPIAMSLINLRPVFVALDPPLFKMLTFELPALWGIAVLILLGGVLGLLGALLFGWPHPLRRPLAML